MSIKTIKLTAQSDLSLFYDYGVEIRSKNSDNNSWSEPKEIHHYFNETSDTVHFFLVENEQYKGRVAAFYHEKNHQLGILGWFECDDSLELSEELLKQAILWLQRQGCKKIIGPINGSTWSSYRFNLDASKPLFAGEPYQPSYYLKQWGNVGFNNDVMYETTLPVSELNQDIDERDLSVFLAEMNLKIRPLPKNLTEDQNFNYFEFYMKSFSDNPLFHEISFDHYNLLTRNLNAVASYDCSFVVVDKNQRPVATFISYKDVYGEINPNSKNNKLFFKTIATHPDWRNKKIMKMVVNYMKPLAKELGYTDVIFSLMYSGNTTAKLTKSRYGSDILRNYTLMSLQVE